MELKLPIVHKPIEVVQLLIVPYGIETMLRRIVRQY